MTDFIGYLGLALMLAGGPVQAGLLLRASRHTLARWFVTSLLVLLIPWNGHSLIYYLRGVTGDLSVASLVIVVLVNCRTLGFPLAARSGFTWQAGLIPVVLLLPLYASTTGYLPFDLYAWGYEPQWFLLALGALLLCAWRVHADLALAWLAGIAAFACGACPSVNILDALFDPFMFAGSLAILFRSACLALISRSSRSQQDVQTEMKKAA